MVLKLIQTIIEDDKMKLYVTVEKINDDVYLARRCSTRSPDYTRLPKLSVYTVYPDDKFERENGLRKELEEQAMSLVKELLPENVRLVREIEKWLW